jgi:hypothetical protein
MRRKSVGKYNKLFLPSCDWNWELVHTIQHW